MIDGNRDQTRAARQSAAPTRCEPHQRDRIRAARHRQYDRGRGFPFREQTFRIAGRDRGMIVVGHGIRHRRAISPTFYAEIRRITMRRAAAGLRLEPLARFCSRSPAALTPLEARGYFRVTSPKAAQAASFSFRAASDWPSRSSASGALPDLSNLVVTARKASAASRYCWRWKKLSPSQYCESATSGSPGYFCEKLRIVSSASA